MRVDLGNGETAAHIQEDDGFDAAAGVTRYGRFVLRLSHGFQFGNDEDELSTSYVRRDVRPETNAEKRLAR
jgi:hypothetical protein